MNAERLERLAEEWSAVTPLSSPRVERRTVRTVRVELPGGRVIRAGVWPGEPGEVVIRTSAPEACSRESLALPADALPPLREALDALAEGVGEA